MSAAPGIFQKLFTSVGDFAKRHKLEKAWQFLQGEHPWVAPAFMAAGSAPVLGLILERHNDERERLSRLLGQQYQPGAYPDYGPYPGQAAVEEARRAVKMALDNSATTTGPSAGSSQPGNGLDRLREMIREAKNRADRTGDPSLSFRGGVEDSS